MMSLQEQIEKDFIGAMKAKKTEKISTLRMLKNAIKNKEIQLGKNKKLHQAAIEEVVSKEVKTRKESISEYQKAGRQDLAGKEQAEVEILKKYLPEQMPEQEIRKIVQAAIQQTAASKSQDMGKVMGQIMPQLKGKADGALISEIVKKELSK